MYYNINVRRAAEGYKKRKTKIVNQTMYTHRFFRLLLVLLVLLLFSMHSRFTYPK